MAAHANAIALREGGESVARLEVPHARLIFDGVHLEFIAGHHDGAFAGEDIDIGLIAQLGVIYLGPKAQPLFRCQCAQGSCRGSFNSAGVWGGLCASAHCWGDGGASHESEGLTA